jgi:hypothetical protein
MNLLPFVVVIITILALFSTSFFDRHVMETKEQQIYLAYFKGLRAARNHKEDLAYRSLEKGGESQSTNSSKKEPSTKKVDYFRDEKIGWKNGRLNLSSLTQDAQKWPELKAITIAYVKQLYSHHTFFPKEAKFTEKLIDALIAAYEDKDSLTPFYELELDDKFRFPFYKMVRGTQTYDLKTKDGYPPFGDFFTFEEREKPPMFFQDANTTFLSIVLGTKKMQIIKDEELKETEESGCHHSSLNRTKLEELFNDSPPSPQQLDLFDFSKKGSPRKPGKHTDSTTQITVRAP